MLKREHDRIMRETICKYGRLMEQQIAHMSSFDGICDSARRLDHADRHGIIATLWKSLDDESRQALLCELEAITDPVTGELTYRTTAAA